MKSRKKVTILTIIAVIMVGLCVLIFSGKSFARGKLKEGMKGHDVKVLQNKLKEENCYNSDVTGYFGEKTKKAVEEYQKSKGLQVDGIVGKDTKKNLGIKTDGSAYYSNTWFNGGNKVFAIGKVATVYDIDTGKTFNIKRTFGSSHADCETLTKEDTKIMKEIFGGYWNWNRRAVILTVDGIKIPASMAGMPHAGRDDKPALAYVDGRSGNYGTGRNLDSIKGNGMNGHFCVHLLGSKTHATNRVEPRHQAMVKKAISKLEQECCNS